MQHGSYMRPLDQRKQQPQYRSKALPLRRKLHLLMQPLRLLLLNLELLLHNKGSGAMHW
jgi:hypothetical protein